MADEKNEPDELSAEEVDLAVGGAGRGAPNSEEGNKAVSESKAKIVGESRNK